MSSLFPKRFERWLNQPSNVRNPFHWDAFPTLWGEGEEELNVGGLTAYDDQNHQFVVEAELPGFKQDEIDVQLHNGVLWIKAERNEEESSKDRKYYRKVENVRNFRYTLPEQINEQQEPKASYKDGVLKISFQKATTATAKKIAIK